MNEREPEFCPRCGKKTFEYSYCFAKLRCSKCGYFLYKKEFEKLKEKAKKENE